jgi:hypothetical protein
VWSFGLVVWEPGRPWSTSAGSARINGGCFTAANNGDKRPAALCDRLHAIADNLTPMPRDDDDDYDDGDDDDQVGISFGTSHWEDLLCLKVKPGKAELTFPHVISQKKHK